MYGENRVRLNSRWLLYNVPLPPLLQSVPSLSLPQEGVGEDYVSRVLQKCASKNLYLPH